MFKQRKKLCFIFISNCPGIIQLTGQNIVVFLDMAIASKYNRISLEDLVEMCLDLKSQTLTGRLILRQGH
jgi:hypothetical protein